VSEHEFRWESPPARSGRYAVAYETALRLSKRPGRWANIAQYKNYDTALTRASLIRNGKMKAYNEVGKFKAQVKSDPQDPEKYALFVMCVERKNDGPDVP
jgi:hypothetical protein